jgi:endonuclease/exonuclease/phosphatase family metal-dependent hydrolase
MELGDPGFPLPERLLSAMIASPWGAIEVYNTHIPDGSTNGAQKIAAFVHLFKRLAYSPAHPRILCGDFNSPQAELADGQIVTWGQVLGTDGMVRFWPAKRGMSGKEWDRGERLVLDVLSVYDMPDVYRGLHGYGVEDFSWYVPAGGHLVGRRFDHVFASSALRARECRYLHSWREEGLSDHSAIEAVFDPV